MKELNFRTLENLKVPDELMDRLLAIPETENEKPPVPLWRRPRFIAMAASLVLVTTLSLALFLTMGNKPPLATKSDSKPDATQIVWSTDEHGATVATEVVVPDAQNHAQPTESKSGIARFFENLFGVTDPTAPPPGSDPSGRVSPTAKDGGADSTKPVPTENDAPSQGGSSVTPIDPSHVDPTTPVDDPTTAPWDDPTTAPWVTPTEPSWDDPTQAPTPPKPTQNPYQSTITNTFSPLSNRYITGQTLYCRVYGLDGTEYGDGDRCSAQHIAAVSYSGGRYTATYRPCDHGILPADGKYRYEFYNGNGVVIAQGTATLSAG